MAKTKKGSSATGGGNKSAFIRERLGKMKASEIVDAGTKAGLSFDVAYVYSVTQNAKKAAEKTGSPTVRKVGRPAGAKTAPAEKGDGHGHGHERELRRIMVHIGVDNFRAMAERIQKQLESSL